VDGEHLQGLGDALEAVRAQRLGVHPHVEVGQERLHHQDLPAQRLVAQA
jgi:hypothetical protein